MKLSEKQKKFCEEYLVDLNATQAAIRAGYSPKTAREQGSRLLSNVNVQMFIQGRQAKLQQKTEITQEKVLSELAKLAFFDPRKLFNEDGQPIPIQDLDDETAACIAGLDVLENYEYEGNEKVFVGYTKKYKLTDKKGSLELLGRHLGIFNDKLDLNLPVTIVIEDDYGE